MPREARVFASIENEMRETCMALLTLDDPPEDALKGMVVRHHDRDYRISGTEWTDPHTLACRLEPLNEKIVITVKVE
jgi:hypothetical protein